MVFPVFLEPAFRALEGPSVDDDIGLEDNDRHCKEIVTYGDYGPWPGGLQYTVNDFSPEVGDIVAVQESLRSLPLHGSRTLPMELVLYILSLAEYHPRLSCRRYVPPPVFKELSDNVQGLYLHTAPLPSLPTSDATIKARWITIQTTYPTWRLRHDRRRRVYWWYELTIIRPLTSAASGTILPPIAHETHEDARPWLRKQGWDILEQVWKVCDNRAGDIPHLRVDWVADFTKLNDESQGIGNGEGFLDTLLPGDRVALWARSQSEVGSCLFVNMDI